MNDQLLLPALPYLIDCPNLALQDLEMEALNLAAQCMKRAKLELEQAVSHRERAGALRLLIENRDELLNLARRTADGKQGFFKFPELAEFAIKKRP